MDILVEIDDDVLLRLLLMAKGRRRSLNEKVLEILKQAARPEKILVRRKKLKSKRGEGP